MVKTLLTTHDVAYATSTTTLFAGVTVTIKEHDRIGLVGKNGAGKTTLLQILAGERAADTGRVTRHAAVAYVPQVSTLPPRAGRLDALLATRRVSYGQFHDAYASIFSAPVPAPATALEALSGGALTKALVALAAAQHPAVLLLDEPTNHLDQKSIDELASWLRTQKSGVVFVSHHRPFLAQVAATIWELEGGALTAHGGGYQHFLTIVEQEADARARQFESTKKQLRTLAQGERMRETKAARAAKVARANKREPSRDKSAENYFRNRSEKGVGKIKEKHDAQRAELTTALTSLRTPKAKTISVPVYRQASDARLLLETKHLDVRAGTRVVVSGVALRLAYGDRITISGENGVGKTLLVKRLAGEVARPTVGVSRAGANVTLALIDQRYAIVDPVKTVFENLEGRLRVLDRERVYKQLGRFQFPEHYAHQQAAALSAGETARLAFAMATIAPLDLLLLDEPTNHLDTETVDVILGALTDFPGALVVVSHDRFVLDQLGIERRYVISDGTLSLAG